VKVLLTPLWVVCGIAVLACVFLAIAAVGLTAGWPYRAERFVGSFDPVRLGLAGFLGSDLLLLIVITLAGLIEWRSTRDRATLRLALTFGGFALATASMFAMLLSAPPTTTFVVPQPVAVGLFLGIGIVAIAMLPDMISAVSEAVRRRDRGLLIAMMVLAALIAVSILFRR
jgi:hypothetical protein